VTAAEYLLAAAGSCDCSARKIERVQPVARFSAEEQLRVTAVAGMRLLCAHKYGALCLRLAALIQQDTCTPAG
jgi:hypothetical protein